MIEKRPSVIRAQNMAFAESLQANSNNVSGIEARRHYMAALAQGAIFPNGRYQDASRHVYVTEAQYTGFLREVGGQRHPSIEGRRGILQNYSKFQPAVDALLDSIATSGTDSRRREDCLASNEYGSDVFRIFVDGDVYEARTVLHQTHGSVLIDNHMAATIASDNEPGFTQVIAAHITPTASVAVNKKLRGSTIDNLMPDDVPSVRENHLEQLVRLTDVATEKGLVLSPYATDVVYDTKTGFSVRNFFSKNAYPSTKVMPTDDNFVLMLEALKSSSRRNRGDESNQEAYANIARLCEAYIPMYKRLLTVVERQPANSDARRNINKVIATIAEEKSSAEYFGSIS